MLQQTDSHDGVSTRAPNHHRNINISFIRQHTKTSLDKQSHNSGLLALQINNINTSF